MWGCRVFTERLLTHPVSMRKREGEALLGELQLYPENVDNIYIIRKSPDVQLEALVTKN